METPTTIIESPRSPRDAEATRAVTYARRWSRVRITGAVRQNFSRHSDSRTEDVVDLSDDAIHCRPRDARPQGKTHNRLAYPGGNSEVSNAATEPGTGIRGMQ